VRDADEIAEERSVDPLATVVGRDARELEKLVDLRLAESEVFGVARGFCDPIAGGCEPLVHSRSVAPPSSSIPGDEVLRLRAA
jgi:hypothetical protein